MAALTADTVIPVIGADIVKYQAFLLNNQKMPMTEMIQTALHSPRLSAALKGVINHLYQIPLLAASNATTRASGTKDGPMNTVSPGGGNNDDDDAKKTEPRTAEFYGFHVLTGKAFRAMLQHNTHLRYPGTQVDVDNDDDTMSVDTASTVDKLQGDVDELVPTAKRTKHAMDFNANEIQHLAALPFDVLGVILTAARTTSNSLSSLSKTSRFFRSVDLEYRQRYTNPLNSDKPELKTCTDFNFVLLSVFGFIARELTHFPSKPEKRQKKLQKWVAPIVKTDSKFPWHAPEYIKQMEHEYLLDQPWNASVSFGLLVSRNRYEFGYTPVGGVDLASLPTPALPRYVVAFHHRWMAEKKATKALLPPQVKTTWPATLRFSYYNVDAHLFQAPETYTPPERLLGPYALAARRLDLALPLHFMKIDKGEFLTGDNGDSMFTSLWFTRRDTDITLPVIRARSSFSHSDFRGATKVSVEDHLLTVYSRVLGRVFDFFDEACRLSRVDSDGGIAAAVKLALRRCIFMGTLEMYTTEVTSNVWNRSAGKRPDNLEFLSPEQLERFPVLRGIALDVRLFADTKFIDCFLLYDQFSEELRRSGVSIETMDIIMKAAAVLLVKGNLPVDPKPFAV